MRNLAILVLAALAGLGSWLFTSQYKIDGLGEIRVSQRESASRETQYTAPPVQRVGETIRIASFNIQMFGTRKMRKPAVVEKLARIVRRFDVVAIQEVRSKDQDILPRFVDAVNEAGRDFDYVIGPRLGRTSSKEQYAFVFDRASIEVDRGQMYTISDPDDVLHREPLVGWFRVRGPPPENSFTFSLVNIHVDPDETRTELNVMDDVYRAVRDDGRDEDDVIILGDLNVDDTHLGELGEVTGLSWVISQIPTNTSGTQQYDNLIFHERATSEFVGRGGTFDFMREFNLTVQEAQEISDHLPVWAEFSIYEGGTPGRVAELPAEDERR